MNADQWLVIVVGAFGLGGVIGRAFSASLVKAAKKSLEDLKGRYDAIRNCEASLRSELESRQRDWLSVSANLAAEKEWSWQRDKLFVESDSARVKAVLKTQEQAEEIKTLKEQIAILDRQKTVLVDENRAMAIEIKRQASRINSNDEHND